MIKSLSTPSNIAFIVFALIAVVFAVHYRTTMLNLYGFYEPDGFYYFTAMRAIVNNGFQFPAVLGISGYPQHNPVAEAHGIYYLALIPYALFGQKVSFYTIMRMLPVLFGLLDMFGAYLLSRYISRDKLFGLLTMIFVALSMGNAARTSALVFRGDSFVTFFLILALIFFVETLKQDKARTKLAMSVAAAVSLSLGNAVWNGAAFAVAIFLFGSAIFISYAFIFRKEKLIDDSKYLLLSLIVWFALANLLHLAGITPGQQLVNFSFVPIYLGLVVLWAFSYYLSSGKIEFTGIPLYRFAALAAFVIVGLLAFALLQPSTVYNLFVGNGFVSAPGSFASTTQELQAPSCQFLYTSFGDNLFTSIPSLFMFLTSTTGFLQCPGGGAIGSIQPLWTVLFGALGIIALLILFIPYLFMQVYDSNGFLGGKPRIKFDVTPGMVALMSFFILTAYLEMHVIRFNSLLSVPLAMLSAYTLYWLILEANSLKAAYPMGRYLSLLAFAIIIIYILYQMVYYAGLYSSSLTQADSINPQFITALQWLKANSPPNSVVLTLWPDGSVVEAVANRTSVMDSVGSENGSKATPFANWLLNTTPDPQFLTTPTLMGSPDYLLTRTSWLIETQGIYTEANTTANASLYGYLPLTSFSEGTANATFKQVVLKTSQNSQYPSIVINLGYTNATGTLNRLYALLELSKTQSVPFQQVVLYDQNNGNYSELNQSSSVNGTNGEMVMLQYSPVPRPGFFINLTGAYVFASGIANSNMLKLIYMCSATQCSWNNKRATMRLVYINSDTRIFKITYNSTYNPTRNSTG